MARTLACTHCGESIALPEAFDRPKIRCPGCGSYAPVPAEQRGSPAADVPTVKPARKAVAVQVAKVAPAPATGSAGVRPRGNPRDRRPEFKPDESGGTPMLAGTQDEDDEKPYGVPGTGLMPCPHCRQELPLDATFCVHCGTDLAGGEKAERVHQPMQGVWEEGLSLQNRFAIMAGFQVVNFILAVVSISAQAGQLGQLSTWATLTFFHAFHIAVQACLIGSFDTLSVTRTARGKTTVTVQRRIGFVKLKAEKIPWRESANIRVTGSAQAGLVEWFTFLYTLMIACVPGVVFYWLVIRPERFQIDLTDALGVTRETIYRSTDREKAAAVAHFVQDATGLHDRAV